MNEMILITDVTYKLHPSPRARCIKSVKDTLRPINEDEQVTEGSHETEDVEGIFFRRPDGKHACIGMTKKVHDVLGLPFDCWGNLMDENDRLVKSLERRTQHLEEASRDNDFLRRRTIETSVRLGKLTFWQRVRILFGADPILVSLDNE